MPIEFAKGLSSHARVQVMAGPAVGQDEPVFTLARPTLGQRFGRASLNVVSHLFCWIPGLKYTKNWHNPSEWQAFRNAVMATHQRDLQQGTLSPGALDTIFSTYSPHKRLTQAKAAAILEEVRRVRGGAQLQPRAPGRLNASQFAPFRGLRTLYARCVSGRSPEARQLLANLGARDDASSDAIRDVLRPGRMISNLSISAGQRALAQLAKDRAHFDWVGRGLDSAPLGAKLNMLQGESGFKDAVTRLRQASLAEPDKPALLSIPLRLDPRGVGLHEAHAVELAVDFRAKKLLYLDAKGMSLETASDVYDAGDMRAALEAFGLRLFGQDWSPDTGIVQITQAKQQGANDCGAFTHDFTRRLIEGHSLGDIERSFDADDRAELRLRMARDIAATAPQAGNAGDGSSSEAPQTGSDGVLAAGRASESDGDDFFDLKREVSGPS